MLKQVHTVSATHLCANPFQLVSVSSELSIVDRGVPSGLVGTSSMDFPLLRHHRHLPSHYLGAIGPITLNLPRILCIIIISLLTSCKLYIYIYIYIYMIYNLSWPMSPWYVVGCLACSHGVLVLPASKVGAQRRRKIWLEGFLFGSFLGYMTMRYFTIWELVWNTDIWHLSLRYMYYVHINSIGRSIATFLSLRLNHPEYKGLSNINKRTEIPSMHQICILYLLTQDTSPMESSRQKNNSNS